MLGLRFLFVLLPSLLVAPRAEAFALLGPYADWMDTTNGFRQDGDIGGPMNLGQGFRWNVPVVTYGFDQSFLDYFGSNGVAAVEAAIERQRYPWIAQRREQKIDLPPSATARDPARKLKVCQTIARG